MAFKRKRIYAPRPSSGRFTKQRRYARRAVRRRGRRVTTYVAGGSTAAFPGYRARRLSARRWRAALWRDTIAQPHYRSNFTHFANITTGLTQASNVWYVRPALADVTGVGPPVVLPLTNPFWQAGGGAKAHDVGGTVPEFANDIILRGGVISIFVAPTSDDVITDKFGVKVLLIRTTTLPALAPLSPSGNANWNSRLDEQPDFTVLAGKIILERSFIASNDQESIKMDFRLGPQKIDQGRFLARGGTTLWWAVHVTNLTSATVVPFTVVRGYNLSFSADANNV